MNWKRIVGKVLPWVIDGVLVVFSLTGVVPNWWPPVLATITVIAQAVLGANWQARP